MSQEPLYPTGNAAQHQIRRRHQVGTLWRTLFLGSTIVGILALTALIYNIVNEAFGLAAVESTIEPAALVRGEVSLSMLTAPNTAVSENDSAIVEAIAADPNGLGFFGYAYYRQNAERLNIVSVNGVDPTAETVASGEYPLTRPLYLYTTADVLQNNQAALIFVNYYLSHVNSVIEEVGYFPTTPDVLSAAQLAYIDATDLPLEPGQWPILNPDGIGGRVRIAGSSTVFPLTQAMAELAARDGYEADVTLESVGTTAGLNAFCSGAVDIANASRPIQAAEYNTCVQNGRIPIELRVGSDALAIVTNGKNSFLQSASREQMQQLFTTAQSWADVSPEWPSEPIQRYIPGMDSGTLDYFTEAVFAYDLSDLSTDQLVKILAINISKGRGRTLEREQRFYDSQLVFESPELWNEVCGSADRPSGCTDRPRSHENIVDLVIQEVVQPDVQKTWPLVESIFNRAAIEAEVIRDYPNATLQFISWLNADFVTSPQSSTPEFAGVRTAILGSLWVVVITVVFSFPVGVGAAIYLEEYADDNRLNRLIQTNINNLAGVPSIIYGLLGLTIFVRVLEAFTSGRFFGMVQDASTANGRTILSAGLTLGLLILPVVIIASQEAIRAVPNSMRQAGMALGATKWQTIWHHVLPSAMPGIMTGTILAIARAVGETAPLVVVGASTFIVVDPNSPFSKFTVLPIQIYQWTSRPQAEFRNIAAAAIIVLLVLLLSLNTTAVLLRNRFSRRI